MGIPKNVVHGVWSSHEKSAVIRYSCLCFGVCFLCTEKLLCGPYNIDPVNLAQDINSSGLLMTYFTEKTRNIWDCGEPQDRLLLVKIVGCFIPCTINLHGCIGYIYCTPLWKSNRNFFSSQIFYHLFFVVCSSFYTWCIWGSQYQFSKYLLDFDHWLYFSDILKKVTGSKPDVALVWFMQWAKMELEHGENTGIGV